jgi:hypothetical protein
LLLSQPIGDLLSAAKQIATSGAIIVQGWRRTRRFSVVVEELLPTIVYPGTFWCGRGSLTNGSAGGVGILAELDR